MIDIIKFEEFKNTFIENIKKYLNNNNNDFENEDFYLFNKIFNMSYEFSDFENNENSYIYNKLIKSRKLFYMLGFKKYKNNKEVKHEYKKIFNNSLLSNSNTYFISGKFHQEEYFINFILNYNLFLKLKYLMDIYLTELNKKDYDLYVVKHIGILPPKFKDIVSFKGGHIFLNDFNEFFDEIN